MTIYCLEAWDVFVFVVVGPDLVNIRKIQNCDQNISRFFTCVVVLRDELELIICLSDSFAQGKCFIVSGVSSFHFMQSLHHPCEGQCNFEKACAEMPPRRFGLS